MKIYRYIESTSTSQYKTLQSPDPTTHTTTTTTTPPQHKTSAVKFYHNHIPLEIDQHPRRNYSHVYCICASVTLAPESTPPIPPPPPFQHPPHHHKNTLPYHLHTTHPSTTKSYQTTKPLSPKNCVYKSQTEQDGCIFFLLR